MKLATWNVNSLKVRLPHLKDWLTAVQPDVVCLQETKTEDANFPEAELDAAGWRCLYSGQKTYNGVAILARAGVSDPVMSIPGFADLQKRVLAATVGGVRVICLYVPNGQSLDSDKYLYKLDWLDRLHAYTRDLLDAWPRCLLLGDFNIAPGDEDVHDPEEWRGKVLCSESERAAFARLIETGLADCYRLFPREGKEYTWWDYRAAGFRRNRGLRIDHILASPPLRDQCRACRIDIEPRRLERPSDHAPIVAEFDL